MSCEAVYYEFAAGVVDGRTVLGLRLVAVPCKTERAWKKRHCPAHARQLELAAEVGLTVPDPPPPEPEPAAEQASLL